jgi:hypothetical protein
VEVAARVESPPVSPERATRGQTGLNRLKPKILENSEVDNYEFGAGDLDHRCHLCMVQWMPMGE